MLTRPTAPLAPARLIAVARRHRALAVPVVLAALLTGSASGVSLIRVHPGDTLSAIALRYHTTVARLVALNHLPGDGDLIYAGQSLAISGSGGGSGRTVYHTVVPGDTLYGIAQHYHVKAATIARRNHLPRSLVVVLVPGWPSPSTAGPPQPASRRGARAWSRGTARSSLTAMSRARTRSTRSSARPPPDGGWIPASRSRSPGRSPAGTCARCPGWMRSVRCRCMPATGSFISADVVRRNLDLYDAQDNITAGVALLSLLTHDARSTRQAVAGYYQGLSSVRAHGMFSSTKQYVADVLALRTQYEP